MFISHHSFANISQKNDSKTQNKACLEFSLEIEWALCVFFSFFEIITLYAHIYTTYISLCISIDRSLKLNYVVINRIISIFWLIYILFLFQYVWSLIEKGNLLEYRQHQSWYGFFGTLQIMLHSWLSKYELKRGLILGSMFCYFESNLLVPYLMILQSFAFWKPKFCFRKTKVLLSKNPSVGWLTCYFGWRTWCPLHWDGVFVTWDRALRTWVSVLGILIKKNVRIREAIN